MLRVIKTSTNCAIESLIMEKKKKTLYDYGCKTKRQKNIKCKISPLDAIETFMKLRI